MTHEMPQRFDDFMRDALYHPERGYYRKARDPFGKDGDFYTASQIQPLFGRVLAAEARAIAPNQPVYELGPGRGEMAAFFGDRYMGIEIGAALPDDLSGLVVANEIFDALPVRAGCKHEGVLYELEVSEGAWVRGERLDSAAAEYVNRYWPEVPEGGRFEMGFEALDWIDQLTSRGRSNVLIIDYGFVTAETRRFPQGTLMSYRNHRAKDDVLACPGDQDITAHVAFDAIIDRAEARGMRAATFETLAQLILRNLQSDPEFLKDPGTPEQLKLLLFGMGETFRCLRLECLNEKKAPIARSRVVKNLG